MNSCARRSAAAAGAFTLLATAGAAAGRYGGAEGVCGFADPQIAESSGVASASWSDGVIWTHNDSGDSARFFAVEVTGCTTVAVYDVAGATATDWEDMARSGTTLYFGDIGDNAERRREVTVYEVPEPAAGAGSGEVQPARATVLRYPDGPHNAESLLVDPTTGRLVIVTKSKTGLGAAYRAPAAGGTMERVADLRPGPGRAAVLATGADAVPGRFVVRTYAGALEWEIGDGEELATALARPPAAVTLPVTVQGEAIGYTRDGSGLWVTSEGNGGPVHRLAAAADDPQPAPATSTTRLEAEPPVEGRDTPFWRARAFWFLAATGLGLAATVGFARKGGTRPR